MQKLVLKGYFLRCIFLFSSHFFRNTDHDELPALLGVVGLVHGPVGGDVRLGRSVPVGPDPVHPLQLGVVPARGDAD